MNDDGPARARPVGAVTVCPRGAAARRPAGPGALGPALRALAAQTWRHPITDAPVGFGFSTIERWYYAARHEDQDPVGVLRRQRRRDAGHSWALSLKLCEVLLAQYRAHPSWSYQLHADNLAVLVAADATLGAMPSYNTLRRYLAKHGCVLQPTPTPSATPGAAQALRRREQLEVRSFEAEYVHGLWHLDFHQGSRKVLTPTGAWLTPTCSACSTIARASSVICSGIWPRPPRPLCMGSRRPSRSAGCRAPC